MVAANLLIGNAELFCDRGRVRWVQHALCLHQLAGTDQGRP